MIKRLLILAIATCFFLENIVIHIVTGNYKTYCAAEKGENDQPENEDGAQKDKKEEYKISPGYKHFFISDTLPGSFCAFDENTCFGHLPDITLPPPDLS